jgi:hypothetical protein
MKIATIESLALAGLLACANSLAATFQEDFASDPAARGWQVFGDASLFRWNSTNGNLRVTWDSSRTNSYYHRPLGTILARDDDFELAFDLRLDSIAIGTTPGKPFSFQVAVGLVNLASATDPAMFRGTGINATNGPRNVCEFNYFPDSGFGATVSPTIISSNNQFASAFTFPLELTSNDVFRVVMTYTASNQTLTTVMTKNGGPFGPIDSVQLGGGFTDFRLDTLAVCSYSDAGQSPPEFAGSILATGAVDNLSLVLPEPPVQDLAGTLTNDTWRAEFLSRTNWAYLLERSTNLTAWSPAASSAAGNGGVLTLIDTNPPPDQGFYRIRAERP